MKQEFDLTPHKDTRYRFWLLGGCVVLALIVACLFGLVTTGNLLLQRIAARPADAGILESASETLIAGTQGARISNRISFVDVQGRIGVVAPDGSDLHVLTSAEERFYQFPAWSPVAQQIAVVGSDGQGSGIYLFSEPVTSHQAEPSELYYSETEAPFYLYWSPDGQQVSFLANHPEGIGLHLVPISAQARSRLLLTGSPFYWNWSLTGDSLFYHTGLTGADSQLAFLDPTTPTPGENVSQAGFFQAPGISSDGHYLAYAEIGEANSRWLVINDLEEDEQQRVPHFGMVAFSWSPNAQELAYISPPAINPLADGFFGSLRIYSTESEEVRTLTDELVLAFFWAPDGGTIAYLKVAESRDDVQAFRPDASNERAFRGKLAQQQQAPLQLSLYTYDLTSNESTLQMTFRPTPLYLQQFLPFFDQYALSHHIWSPDSSRLVLPLIEDETQRIYVVPLDGTPWSVTDGAIAFWSFH